MFAADRLEQTALMNHVILQLGERPTSIRQPEFCRRLLSDSSNFIHLCRCDARRSTLTWKALKECHPRVCKAMYAGVDRVDVNH